MSRFVTTGDIEREQLDWGGLGWISRPELTGAKQLTVIDVSLEPGFGHDFHKHPEQEEVIVVQSGRVEQWLEGEKQELGPGEAVYIDADVVHASFNVGDATARLTVTLGPCAGDGGYELVEVAGEEPWASMRRAPGSDPGV
jgi:quercetin dioxygenase-like cupin family protein